MSILGTWLSGTSTQYDDLKEEMIFKIDEKIKSVTDEISLLKNDIKTINEKLVK